MTAPVVHETSPAPLPVDHDPFLEVAPQPTAIASAAPAAGRRRILD